MLPYARGCPYMPLYMPLYAPPYTRICVRMRSALRTTGAVLYIIDNRRPELAQDQTAKQGQKKNENLKRPHR